MATSPLYLAVMAIKEFQDYSFFSERLDKLVARYPEVVLITTYSAMAERWAKENYALVYRYSETKLEAVELVKGVKKRLVIYWKLKSVAKEMVRDANAVVVFWDLVDKKISNLLRRANKKGIKVREYLV